MAIHAAHPGLEVEVIVNDKALQEYVDNELEQDEKATSNYVEASSGSAFAIRVCVPKGLFTTHSVRAVTWMDGIEVDETVWERRRYKYAGAKYRCDSRAVRLKGKDMCQKFQFAEFETTETCEDVNAALKKRLTEVGLISISFYRITNVRLSTTFEETLPILQSNKAIPEKALKGLDVTHRAQLGLPQPGRPMGYVNFDNVEGECAPFAIFHFKYRSLKVLKALGLIPRTPSPVPLEDRSIEELNPAELAELVKRYRAHEAEARNVKREGANATKRELDFSHGFDDDDELTVIDERPRKRQNRPREDDEVIVLD